MAKEQTRKRKPLPQEFLPPPKQLTGLVPRNEWWKAVIGRRGEEILVVLREFTEAGVPVRTEWIDELQNIFSEVRR